MFVIVYQILKPLPDLFLTVLPIGEFRFKNPTHSRVMAGRKGMESEILMKIKSALKSDFCTFS